MTRRHNRNLWLDWLRPRATTLTGDTPMPNTDFLSLAQAAETNLLAEQPAALTEHWAAHNKDCAHYQCSPRRWGDFLALEVQRWGHGSGIGPFGWLVETEEAEHRQTVAVPLAQVRDVLLVPGHGPDRGAQATWYQGGRDGALVYHQISSYGRHNTVYRPMWVAEAKPGPGNQYQGMWGSGGPEQVPGIVTEGLAQPAKDDEIRFNGAGVLYVPCGLGSKVWTDVMREMERYRPAAS